MDNFNNFEQKQDVNVNSSYSSTSSTNYKCPNCGAPISLDAELQLFKCDFCWSKYSPESMEVADQKRIKKEQQRIRHSKNQEAKARASNEVVLAYHCENCGADVVTDETTTATFCYYCHSPVILESRLLGNDRPDEIIPFSISREHAQQLFLDWTKTKRYLPNDFRTKAHLEKMTGVYIPYWFMDSDVKVNFVGTSKKSQSNRVGDYLHTEVTSYAHQRRGTQYFTDVNVAGTNKIDINLLNGIEPFDSDKIQKFSMPMLSGFFAESYTLNEANANKFLEQTILGLADRLLSRSFSFTGAVNPTHKNFVQKSKGARYVMLPIWILTYNYQGKIYVFGVNGESGEATGELPIVKSKLYRDSVLWGLLVAAIAFILIFLLS